VASFSDIPASVLSRLNLTASKSCSPDKGTESCQSSPSGTTSKHLTVDLGGDSLMSSAEDSLAKTSAVPAEARGLKASDLDCGPNTQGSLAKYDPNTSSWKTRQSSLLGGLESYSETWPRWGMIWSGEFFPLPMPFGLEEHRAWITSVLESGSRAQRLPTLTAFDAMAPMLIGKEYDGSSRHAMKLMQGIQRLQTPTVQDAHGRDRHNQKDGGIILSLLGECRRMPTPQTSDNRDRGNMVTTPCIAKRAKAGKQMMLSQVAKDRPGNLNPDWTEWFMGWPIKWTALSPLETDRFQQWLLSHGPSSRET